MTEIEIAKIAHKWVLKKARDSELANDELITVCGQLKQLKERMLEWDRPLPDNWAGEIIALESRRKHLMLCCLGIEAYRKQRRKVKKC